MKKAQRKFIEDIYCEFESGILLNNIDEDMALSIYKNGVIPVKKLSTAHILKSINERYPFNCRRCDQSVKVKSDLKCPECGQIMNERVKTYFRVEYDPMGNPDNCNTMDTHFCYIEYLPNKNQDIEKEFTKKTGLPKNYIYFYSTDDLYVEVDGGYDFYEGDVNE